MKLKRSRRGDAGLRRCAPGSHVDTDCAAEGPAEDDDALSVDILASREMGDHSVGVHLYSLLVGLALASSVASVGDHEHIHLQLAPKHMHTRKPHSHVASIFLFVEDVAVSDSSEKAATTICCS